MGLIEKHPEKVFSIFLAFHWIGLLVAGIFLFVSFNVWRMGIGFSICVLLVFSVKPLLILRTPGSEEEKDLAEKQILSLTVLLCVVGGLYSVIPFTITGVLIGIALWTASLVLGYIRVKCL